LDGLWTLFFGLSGLIHTMAEGWEAIDFHQSNGKKPRVWSLDPSHYGQSHYGQSPKAVSI
jgi:hypothetical protein